MFSNSSRSSKHNPRHPGLRVSQGQIRIAVVVYNMWLTRKEQFLEPRGGRNNDDDIIAAEAVKVRRRSNARTRRLRDIIVWKAKADFWRETRDWRRAVENPARRKIDRKTKKKGEKTPSVHYMFILYYLYSPNRSSSFRSRCSGLRRRRHHEHVLYPIVVTATIAGAGERAKNGRRENPRIATVL